MFLTPVIERELRRASHKKKATKSRFRVALGGAAAVVLFLWFFALSGSGGWGQNLHALFLYAGLYLAIAPPMRIISGLFSEERRNQTLELLFLTGMGSVELFAGKLLGGTLIASSDLLALAPFLALPFLMGGISPDLYFATLACLPAMLLFALAVGSLASVLFKDDGVAFIFTVVFAAFLCLAVPVPYYLGKELMGSTPFSPKWLCVSPAYAPYLISINFIGAGRGQFWLCTLATFAWSVLCLVLACVVLNHNWCAEVQKTRRTNRKSWLVKWIHGRTAAQNNLLLGNPFQWLVRKDRRLVLLCYGAIVLIGAVWLMGWRAWPKAWPSTANFFLTAMILIATVTWLKLLAAARRLGTDRREGILELLLTTPLSPQEIIDGEMAAVKGQFKPLQWLVLCLLVLMMVAGFLIRSWNARAVITYLLAWFVLFGWCLRNHRARILNVMWAALNTGRPVYSVFKWRSNQWTWIWMLFNLRNLVKSGFGAGAAGFPSGSVLEFTLVCVIGLPLCAVYFDFRRVLQEELERDLRKRLTLEMRLIATEPIPDPNDPEYEKWESRQRLQYRGSTQTPSGWPVFVDPIETVQLGSRGGPKPADAAVEVVVLQDTVELLRRLRAQEVGFVVAGGLARNARFGNGCAKDAHLLMRPSALGSIAELHLEETTDFFCRAQFRGIRAVVYSTEQPVFEAVQRQFAETLHIGGVEVAAATVEGLIALDLYALHLLSKYREYYRNDRYERNLIALLAHQQPSLGPILALMRAHIPETSVTELEDTLETCARYAARLRRRAGLVQAI